MLAFADANTNSECDANCIVDSFYDSIAQSDTLSFADNHSYDYAELDAHTNRKPIFYRKPA